jgi:hypothetical protein
VLPTSFISGFYTNSYSVRGISFEAASNRVPELNASAVGTALALMVGALALLLERRRAAVRA